MKITKESIVTVTSDSGYAINENDKVIVVTKDNKALIGLYRGINKRGAITLDYQSVVMNIMPSSIKSMALVESIEIKG